MADNPSVRAGTVGGTIVVVADEITSPYTGDTAQAQGIKILDGVANSPTPAHVTSSGMLSTMVGNQGTVSVSGTPNVHVTNSGTVSVTGAVDTELPAAGALADNTANPTVPGVGSFGHVWDGATWDRQPGSSSAGALVHQTNQGTVSVSNTVTVTANGGTILGQAGTVTALQGTSPWVTHQNNNGTVSVTGAVDTELPAAASLADNTANPSTPSVGAFPHWYDGATWDRAKGDSADGLLVNLGANNDVTVTGTVSVSGGTALGQAGTVTALQGTSPWVTHQSNNGTVSVSNTVTVTANGGTLLGQAGTVTALQGTSPWVTHQNNNGTVSVTGTPNVHVTNSGTIAALPGGLTGFAEDVGHTTGDVGIQALSVRKNEAAATSGSDNDYQPLITNNVGALWTHVSGGTVVATGGGDGAIQDGANSTIEATVFDYANSNPLSVRLTDTSGDYVGAGGGTQYDEDAPSVGAEKLTLAGAIRRNEPAVGSGADGDYSTVNVDTAGALWAHVNAGTVGISGTPNVHVTNAATVVANGGTILGQAGTVTALQGSNPWVTHQSNNGTVSVTGTPNVHVTNSATVSVSAISAGDNNIGNVDVLTLPGGITGFAEDAQHTTGDVGVAAMAVRKNVAAALAGADADYTPLITTSDGSLWTHINAGTVAVSGTPNMHQTNSSTVSVSAISAGDNNIGNVDIVSLPGGITGFAEDVGHTTGDVGIPAMAVRKNVAAALAGADADYTPLISSSDGSLWTHINAGTVAVSGTPNVHVTNSGTVSVSNTVTVDSELPAAAALADNTANPTVPGVGAFGMVWDGANWDRTPGNTAAGVLTHQTNSGTVSVSGTPNVHITNTGTVTATDLDIRNLTITNDSVTAGSAVIGLGYTLGASSINLTASGTVATAVASRVLYVTHEAFTVQGGTITITATNGAGGGTLWGPMQFSPTGGMAASQGIMDGGLYETASGSAVYYVIAGSGTVGGRIRYARLAS